MTRGTVRRVSPPPNRKPHWPRAINECERCALAATSSVACEAMLGRSKTNIRPIQYRHSPQFLVATRPPRDGKRLGLFHLPQSLAGPVSMPLYVEVSSAHALRPVPLRRRPTGYRRICHPLQALSAIEKRGIRTSDVSAQPSWQSWEGLR